MLKIELLIIIIVVILLFGVFNFSGTSLLFVKSNDKYHLVRDLPNKQEAANLLAEIKKRLQILIDYCIINYPSKKEVQFLKKRFNENNIQESDLKDSGTSFSIDKGKEIHLCIRDKKDTQFHEINLLMYVAIHEAAHILNFKTYGHDKHFMENFKWLLKQSIKVGIYKPVNYAEKNKSYCGTNVTSNILYS